MLVTIVLSVLMLVDVVRAIDIICFISFSDLLLGWSAPNVMLLVKSSMTILTIVIIMFPGLIPAISHHFVNSVHKGCYFHHTQAVWRHVQVLGLQVLYNTDREVNYM